MIKLFILWCVRTFTPTNIMWFFRAVWCWAFVWHRWDKREGQAWRDCPECFRAECGRCDWVEYQYCSMHASRYYSY